MEFLEQIEKAERFFSMGFAAEAKALFTRILSLAPEQPRVLNNLGVISFQQGELSKAEDYLVKALAIQPDYEDAWTNLNQVFFAQGKSKETAEALRRRVRRITETGGASGDSPPRPSNPIGAPESGLNPPEENDTEALHSCRESDALDEAPGSRRSSEPGQSAFPSHKPEEHFPKPQDDRSSASPSPYKNDSSEPAPALLPASEDHRTHRTQSRPRYASRPPAPTVSVGLPVYNGGKYLAEAIESILSQDFEDFELIISDNHSTDETPDICEKYAGMDDRIRYVRNKENVGANRNGLKALALSTGMYFMWASHDDLHEKSFINKCLEKLQADESIVLVYPKTKLLDSNSKYLGIANDFVEACQDDAVARFTSLIWTLSLCNMVYGLYRSHIVKNAEYLGKTVFGDNLFLAEIALSGKIVQIDEPLFIRRLTRNYNYKSPDERYAQLIADCDPSLFHVGIDLPYCRLAFAHMDLVNQSNLKPEHKELLITDVIKCFRSRFGTHMKYEIDRAVHLISKGIYFWTWRNDPSEAVSFSNISKLGYYRISYLLKTLQEALLIHPERTDLIECYSKCFAFLNNSNR